MNMDDKYIITKTGQQQLCKTIVGWDLLVRWKDGSEQWIKPSELKESHPVEDAEFTKARGILSKEIINYSCVQCFLNFQKMRTLKIMMKPPKDESLTIWKERQDQVE